VQVPAVLHYAGTLRLRPEVHSAHVREVAKNFVPVLVSRGVVQISAFVDQAIASWIGTGAMAGMTAAQSIYTLPVSLFGMAVSAAELPAMSSALGTETEVAARLRQRLNSGLRQIAFFIVPSAMAFFALGDVIAAALYEHGKFTHDDSIYVWAIIAGSAVGLLASTLGRLYASTYYALRDTRTPLNYAVIRVILTTVLGYLCAIPLPRSLGLNPMWGAAGLTASAGVAGWVEMLLLRSSLNRRIGRTGLPSSYVASLWSAAASSAAAGWGVKLVLPPLHPAVTAVAVLGAYGVVFLGVAFALRIPEVRMFRNRLSRFR